MARRVSSNGTARGPDANRHNYFPWASLLGHSAFPTAGSPPTTSSHVTKARTVVSDRPSDSPRHPPRRHRGSRPTMLAPGRFDGYRRRLEKPSHEFDTTSTTYTTADAAGTPPRATPGSTFRCSSTRLPTEELLQLLE